MLIIFKIFILQIFAWGYNGNGQLGVGNNTNQPCPYKVTGLGGIFIVKVICNFNNGEGINCMDLLHMTSKQVNLEDITKELKKKKLRLYHFCFTDSMWICAHIRP